MVDHQSLIYEDNMADRAPAPPGGFAKRHVSGMLKYLADDDQRAKALEVAAGYQKLFAQAEWEPVFARMKRVAEEDDLRVVGRRRPPPLTTSTSAPPAAMADVRSPPAELPRLSTANSLLPLGRRVRGPSTPSSAGNAFAPGGFWEQLTPKTPAPAPTPQTPISAIPPSPFSPIVPKDRDARAAYDQVKGEAEAVARTICANRMSVYYTVKNSDDIPKKLLRRKDLLKGAETILEQRQANLQTTINPDLPKLLRDIAEEEAKILQQYSVKDIFGLVDADMWLRVDYQPLTFTTLLDVQRELIRMHHNRRKDRVLELPDHAVHQAWATRILEDAEHALEFDGDDSSVQSEEDKGYNYNNFLRSIKREATSSSNLVAMLEKKQASHSSLRTSGTNLDSLNLSRQTTLASLSGSQDTSHRLPFRSSGHTLADSPCPSPRKRESGPGRNRGLGRITTNIKEGDTSPAPLSPEDRAYRRQGASIQDLDAWSKQLKEMEQQQLANKNKVMAQTMEHLALQSPSHSRQGSDDTTLGGMQKRTAEHKKKNKSMHNLKIGIQNALHSRSPSSGLNFSRPLASQTSSPVSPSFDLPPPMPPVPPGHRYAPGVSSTQHGSTGRRQGSQSSGFAMVAPEGEVDEWDQELKRMEDMEMARQAEAEAEREMLS
jgi:hypothetical protein